MHLPWNGGCRQECKELKSPEDTVHKGHTANAEAKAGCEDGKPCYIIVVGVTISHRSSPTRKVVSEERSSAKGLQGQAARLPVERTKRDTSKCSTAPSQPEATWNLHEERKVLLYEKSVESPGHCIDAQGVHTATSKFAAIEQAP